jgi:hypothetical protein
MSSVANDLRVERADDGTHCVLVYRTDAQLIEVGGTLLSNVLAAGGAAVVLATEMHLAALERWVGLCGVDVQAASAERRYRRVGIETVLGWLERNGDAAATFEVRLEALLDEIPGEIAPVVIFGEVAAALWERGHVSAALSLEAVSSTLCVTRAASILCAYPEGVLASASDVERACDRHTAVLDAPTFPGRSPKDDAAVISSAVLPPAPAACRTARQLVRAALALQGRATDAAELVVGELAANAVRHAGSTFTAEVSVTDGMVRIAVTDATPLPHGFGGFPLARDHGLGVVAALASDWAVQPLAGGKVVWADMARSEV